MKIVKLLACIFLAGSLFACAGKGEPSTVGVILTPEQIAELSSNSSRNGELVAVKGYPEFAKKLVKLGTKNMLSISATPGGEELIRVNVGIHNAERSEGVQLTGEKSRNFASLTQQQSLQEATFTLDDYTEVPYGEFLFSGTLVYDDGAYYLENVTIHPIP